VASVSVWFNFQNYIASCRPGGHGPRRGSDAGPIAGQADNCNPPTGTKITVAKINQGRHTAFFRFTAHHASRFQCELIRNGKIMFRRTCNSPKPYANPLSKGRYLFVVMGVNHAGMDPVPAMKLFGLR
jgi:hypothetical protein